jgi:hypothetical protein
MDIGEVRCPQCKKPMTPTTLECRPCGLRLSGQFSISPLAGLSPEDQALVIVFVKSFGSIKQIQKILGVSYPTARTRIERVVEKLNRLMEGPPDASETLDRLDAGEITFDEAIARL